MRRDALQERTYVRAESADIALQRPPATLLAAEPQQDIAPYFSPASLTSRYSQGRGPRPKPHAARGPRAHQQRSRRGTHSWTSKMPQWALLSCFSRDASQPVYRLELEARSAVLTLCTRYFPRATSSIVEALSAALPRETPCHV